MATIKSIEIRGYRSIKGPLNLRLPAGKPVVLIGENNAGKSNVVRAFDMVLGQAWTGSHDPEDHEFYNRNRNEEIEIRVHFDPEDLLDERFNEAIWSYNVARPGAAAHQVGPSQYARADRRHDYMSNDIKSSCICVVIEADRNLSWHLSYATRWTFLSRLMHGFHKELMRDEDTTRELEQLFRNVKERFERVQSYVRFSDTLKEQLVGFSGNMTHRLEVDFQAYNPINFFHALRLQALEGDSPRTLGELGTGEQQILALSFAYAYASAFHRGMMLVIEEPEAHLHPLAQQWLAKYMRELAEGGLQVVLTTHSAHFIDIENIEGLVRVYRDASGTQVVQKTREDLRAHCVGTGVPGDRITVENILPFYSAVATPQILEGFFAKVVVLVEGPTEALALPVYLERVGLVAAREGVAVIPVGGKGNLGKWRRVFQLYGIPAVVVFDNDGRQDDRSGAKRKDALLALGVPVEEHDDIVTSAEWLVRSELMVFPENFERSFETEFNEYHQLAEQAADEGVESKPFVARWVATRMPIDEQPGWACIKQFSVMLAGLTAATPFVDEVVPQGPQQVHRRAPRRRP